MQGQKICRRAIGGCPKFRNFDFIKLIWPERIETSSRLHTCAKLIAIFKIYEMPFVHHRKEDLARQRSTFPDALAR